jgi:hypothetical protein
MSQPVGAALLAVISSIMNAQGTCTKTAENAVRIKLHMHNGVDMLAAAVWTSRVATRSIAGLAVQDDTQSRTDSPHTHGTAMHCGQVPTVVDQCLTSHVYPVLCHSAKASRGILCHVHLTCYTPTTNASVEASCTAERALWGAKTTRPLS